MFSSKSKREEGQGLVEYAIIISLVAIVVLGVMRVLGPKVCNTFDTINSTLPGGSGGSTSNCGSSTSGGQNFGYWGEAWVNSSTAQGAVSYFCSSYPSYHGGYNIYQTAPSGYTISGNIKSGSDYTFVGTGSCP